MTASRLFFAFFLFISIGISAQEEEKPADLPGWKLKNYVKGYEKIGDTYTAISMAEEYLIRHPNREKMQRTLAKLYTTARDYKAAVEMYEQLYESNKDKDPEIHFNYAMMLKRAGKYGKAEAMFTSFQKTYPNNKKTAAYYEIIDTELKGARFASSQPVDKNMVIVHLDNTVNMAHVDFSPFPIDDSTLLYASLKSSDVFYESDNVPKRRFYLARKVDEGIYKELPFKYDFNDPEFDCGNGVFSDDGTMFIYTKCSKETSTSKAYCKLYLSLLKGGKWQDSRELPAPLNGNDFTTSYPCFGIDSKKNTVLYFSSNRPNGKGGMDIWYSIYDSKKGGFKAPKNCGKEINSTRDDITPYYNSSTKLFYFSSESHLGFGGLDIYRTEGEQKRWNKPKNMGMPLNSPADDLYYIQRKDNESGYLVSNREGGVTLENNTCCDDIYEFYLKKPVDIILIGTVTEEIDPKQPAVADAKGYVGLYLDIEDKLVLVQRMPLRENREFKFKLSANARYKLIVEKEGYFRASSKISTLGIINSDSIYVSPTLKQIPYAPIVVNIYYPFDKDYLTAPSKHIIDTTIFKIMVDNPEIIMEIGSHTDGLGTNEYNDALSQRRAESVVNYLTLKGIPQTRLTAKGYGKRVELAPNFNADGTDNPDGRAINRRTEFKVTGLIPGSGEVTDDD